jgi:hypothetical protein
VREPRKSQTEEPGTCGARQEFTALQVRVTNPLRMA